MNESEQKQWIRQAHAEVDDLFARSPAIYWTDLLISATVAWTATVAYFALPWGSPGQLIGLIVAGIAFYRAGTFMHEIIHMPRGELTWFKHAWNLLVGIPLLMPWILYRNHIEHHSRAHFGTPRDGEYLPLAAAPLRETFLYLLRIPILPLMALARFGLAGPLSRFSPTSANGCSAGARPTHPTRSIESAFRKKSALTWRPSSGWRWPGSCSGWQ